MKKTCIATLLICSTLFIVGCGQSKQSNQESNSTVTENKQEDNSSSTQDNSKNQSSNSETTNSQNNSKTENLQSNTENQENNNTNKINKKDYYTKKLNDIQSKIDTDKDYDFQKAMTTSEMRQTSGGQYKLWDDALNQIYKDLQSSLSSDDKKKLEQEELLWISQKESDAKVAGDQVKGGTLEPVYHTLSLVDSTKKRCYELVEKYMN